MTINDKQQHTSGNVDETQTTELLVRAKIEPALLTIPQVCAYLNIARATFYKINATGAFGLLPVKLGTCRKVLYSRAELDSYVKSNCPHRKLWQAQRVCDKGAEI
jgi:predicted DNA-binding transcriptional regulator AlpA